MISEWAVRLSKGSDMGNKASCAMSVISER